MVAVGRGRRRLSTKKTSPRRRRGRPIKRPFRDHFATTWSLSGDRVLPSFTEFYRDLPSFTDFSRVLQYFIEFNCVLPSFTEPTEI